MAKICIVKPIEFWGPQHSMRRYQADLSFLGENYILEYVDGLPKFSFGLNRFGLGRLILRHIWLPVNVAFKSRNFDLLLITDHSMAQAGRMVRKAKSILVVHDLTMLNRRVEKIGILKYSFRKYIYKSATCYNYVVFDSYNSKKDYEEIIGGTDKSSIIYPLVEGTEKYNSLKTNSYTSTTGSKYSQVVEVLHVGNDAAYKNRDHIFQVAKLSHRQHLNLLFRLVGPKRECDLPNVVQYENVSENNLNDLYAQSDVFLFPSLYEGFGWPPLEAQKFGCPVVATRNGSLDEILGNSCGRIDGRNPENTIEMIFETFEKKTKWIEAGYRNVARFSREKFQSQWVNLVSEILN